jgi:hypothetical protein
VKRPLRELRRGDVFRTADGRLWWLYAHGQPPYGRSWAGGVGREEDTFPLPSDESVEPLDLPALLSRLKGLERENNFLRGQLSDLWEDRTGAAVGAEAERGAVLGLIRGIRDRLPCADASDDEDAGMQAVLNVLWRNVQARGPRRPPVPPHRLEGVLREVAEVLQRWHDGRCRFGTDFGALLARVREALGEG